MRRASSLWHRRAGVATPWKYFSSIKLSTNESTISTIPTNESAPLCCPDPDLIILWNHLKTFTEVGGSGVEVVGQTEDTESQIRREKQKWPFWWETLPTRHPPEHSHHSDFPGPWIRRLIKRSNQIDRKLYVSWSIPNNTILTRIILCDDIYLISTNQSLLTRSGEERSQDCR